MIFRLVEELARTSNTHDLDITVISAISSDQVIKEKSVWHARSLFGNYQWSIISETIHKLSGILYNKFPLSASIFNRILGTYSLQSSIFTHHIRDLYQDLKPDYVILDTAPQYIHILAHFIPSKKLIFYCRADMGSSRRFLNIPRLILTMDEPLSDWIHKINPSAAPCFVVHDSLPAAFSDAKWNPERFTAVSPIILFVGRISPEKGLEFLIQAFEKVQAIRQDVRLVIVGAEWAGHDNTNITDTEYGRKVRAMSEHLLPGSIEWKGWLDINGLSKEYSKAYMAVYPSTWVEGFGMVATEAMAFGVPVIASNSPGFQAQLQKGGGVLIDNPKDIESLANTILRLLADTKLSKELGLQGFQLAHEYTVERTAKNFLNAFESLPLSD
jgi:glycosyltransferase involved in cell wall biosynthesis